MAASNGKRSYSRDLKRAYSDCVTDITVYAISAGVFAACLAALLLIPGVRELAGGYLSACRWAAGMFLGLSLNGTVSALVRKKAVNDVMERSVYAVKLTAVQQDRIYRRLSAQIAKACLYAFLGAAIPVSAVLAIRFLSGGRTRMLSALALADGVWLLLCVFSYFFETADIRSRDGFCTVADEGIITSGKVYDFAASAGDVKELVCYDDVYSVSFLRRSFFGIRLMTEYPLPRGGALSRELAGGNELEILVRTLQPARTIRSEGPYPERRKRRRIHPGGRPVLRIAALVLIAAVAVTAGFALKNALTPAEPEPAPQPEPEPAPQPEPDPNEGKFALHYDERGGWFFTVGEEEILFVDDAHPVTEDFGPVSSDAEDALEEMMEAAQKDGISLYTARRYRSWEDQKDLFEDEDPTSWAVAPGLSEHQSGLAFDLDVNGEHGTLQDPSFADTEAYRWLCSHCAEYGFILRYPKDKTAETGRMFEPWHFRYVGREVAQLLQKEHKVLDEIVY